MNGTALITGASQGIGLELAQQFASNGHDLVLVARNEARLRQVGAQLEQAHGITATVIASDLSTANAACGIVESLQGASIEVHVLVNNAGFGLSGPFLANDPQTQLNLLQVNVMAMTQLTRLLLPPMVARGSGRILNVASVAAFVPGPQAAIYCATKAYVLSFSEAIAEELRHSGVTVTAVCPGPTQTGFGAAAGAGSTRLYSKQQPMPSAEVARVGYRGLINGRRVVVVGLRNKLLVQSARIGPRRLVTRVGRWLWEPT
jgi:short-subunit dehydrogenase